MSNHQICNNCKSTQNSKVFSVKGRKYGSLFDGLDFEVCLCDDCQKEIDIKCFDNNPQYSCEQIGNEYYGEFELIRLIGSFDIDIQESILNKPNPKCPFVMDKEDWIDMYKGGFFNF